MRRLLASLIAVACIASAGCDSEEVKNELRENIEIKFDPALPISQRNLLIDDIHGLYEQDLKVASRGYFQMVFGGSTSIDVLRYLDARVNYFVPASIQLDDRIEAWELSQWFGWLPGRKDKPVTIARNVGIQLWYLQLANYPRILTFSIGGSRLLIDSPRIGIVQLDKGYRSDDPRISRISTLVHEARHSDCPQGSSRDDVERLMRGDFPLDRSCGNLHVICPEGHEYAGYAACDGDPWGAYAVEAIYLETARRHCVSCSREEKEIARIKALDSNSRVLVLREMLMGKHGPPKMSSIGAEVPHQRRLIRELKSDRERKVRR